MAISAPIPPKHTAVVVVKPRAPLETIELDTVAPAAGEVLVRVHYAGSTPLNLHNADGGLLIEPPFVMSACFSGTVVQVGPPSPSAAASGASEGEGEGGAASATTTREDRLQPGDPVFGFAWAEQKQRPHQEYITVPAYLCGKVPANLTLEQAASVPSNFATAYVAIAKDLGLPLPWPLLPEKGEGEEEPSSSSSAEKEKKSAPVLVWGAASSVGQYAVQLLGRVWGYANVLAVARAKHHDALRALGATRCFDYTDPDVVEQILSFSSTTSTTTTTSSGATTPIPYIIDCIGSVHGTLAPLSKLARRGTTLSVMLPVIARHATPAQAPLYEMDVTAVALPGGAAWDEGVVLRGARTHFYPRDGYLRDVLLPEIMPALVAAGKVLPNRVRRVEGKTVLERAEGALALFRRGEVSGEKLVWRVWEE